MKKRRQLWIPALLIFLVLWAAWIIWVLRGSQMLPGSSSPPDILPPGTAQTTPTAKMTHQPTFTPTPDPAPLGREGKWRLIFDDEFSGDTLDQKRWATCYWWDNDGCTNSGNHELQWYTPDSLLVENGMLRMRASQTHIDASDGHSYEYASGMVTTGPSQYSASYLPSFSFTGGYAEIRARTPGGAGLWPAFWLLPVNRDSTPEIDVLEVLGDDPLDGADDGPLYHRGRQL